MEIYKKVTRAYWNYRWYIDLECGHSTHILDGHEAKIPNEIVCKGCEKQAGIDRANNLDPKTFQQAGNKDCAHTVGFYKSGRCRACGIKMVESLRKRAWKMGLQHLLRPRPRNGWEL